MITDPVRTSHFGSRAMTEEEVQTFLTRIRYGTLSYVGSEGWPDSRVLNFGIYEGDFYFHSHKAKGEKLPFISDGQKACISFYEPSPDVGLMRHCQHNSVLVYGNVERLDNRTEYLEEAYDGLANMCDYGGTPWKAYPEKFEQIKRTCSIFRVKPIYIVGKLTMFTSLPEMSYLELQHCRLGGKTTPDF